LRDTIRIEELKSFFKEIKLCSDLNEVMSAYGNVFYD
jgi:hypothetical protein